MLLLSLGILLTLATKTSHEPIDKKFLLTDKQYAKQRLQDIYMEQEYQCLLQLWHRESKWNPKAKNKKSTARGIPQLLNLPSNTGSKRQIDLGLKYIVHRYSTPCVALKFHKRHGWY